MLIKNITYPDIAPVSGRDDPRIAHAVWNDLYGRGALSAHMTFSSPLKMNKWERPERLELKILHISDTPIPGIDTKSSIYHGAGNEPVHVALEDQDGELHSLINLSEGLRGTVSKGILTTDRNGSLWFCDATGSDRVTGTEKLRRLKGETSPLMALCEGEPGASFTLTEKSMMGSFLRLKEEVICLYEDMIAGDQMSTEQAAEFDRSLSRIAQRIDAIMDRQDGIGTIVKHHFTDENLARLVPDMTQDLVDGLVPAYSDFERAKIYNDTLGDISMEFMNDLRSEGFCLPCPNNGPREVSTMKAWNLWMEGGFDEIEQSFETRMLRHRLTDSPAFDMVGAIIMRACFEVTDRIWKENNPGQRRAYSENEKTAIPAARIPEIFSVAREALLECFTREEDRIMLMRSENLASTDDGTRYVLAGSFLTPELALRAGYEDDPVPLPPQEAPAYIRHLEIPMPSGKLVMADWFRVDGFKEGIVRLCGDDDYDINTSVGLDLRARNYFEKAGISIVQVGNTSPDAICETDGIWRMGYFDEDHDDLWTEDGESKAEVKPDILWKTCTDLWANTFADRETVISVLMASDVYGDRSAAGAALDDYIEESYGANCIDLGVSTLHLYAPTGAGIHKGNFEDVFKASEIDNRDWIDDMYILAREKLTVDPELLEDEVWVAAGLDVNAETPEP